MKVVNISHIPLSSSGSFIGTTFQLRKIIKRNPNNKLLVTVAYSAGECPGVNTNIALMIFDCPELTRNCNDATVSRNVYTVAIHSGSPNSVEHDFFQKKTKMLLIDDLPTSLRVGERSSAGTLLWKYTFVLEVYEVEV